MATEIAKTALYDENSDKDFVENNQLPSNSDNSSVEDQDYQ